MHVKTDHQIVAHGDDVMKCYDEAGDVLATATRVDGGWHVETPSTRTDEPVPDRRAAIAAISDHVFTHLGPKNDLGHGYSQTEPHGIHDLP